MAEWWDGADESERCALLALTDLRDAGLSTDGPFSDRVRDAMLGLLFGSGSRLAILPVQDTFGWRDRINVPAVVDQVNWTWKLPIPVEALSTAAESRDRAHALAALARRCGRKAF